MSSVSSNIKCSFNHELHPFKVTFTYTERCHFSDRYICIAAIVIRSSFEVYKYTERIIILLFLNITRDKLYIV